MSVGFGCEFVVKKENITILNCIGNCFSSRNHTFIITSKHPTCENIRDKCNFNNQIVLMVIGSFLFWGLLIPTNK